MIATKDLLRALSTVRPVVDAKSSIPILSHALLRAVRGELSATATDLTTILIDRCAFDGPDLAVAVPVKDLIARVKAMPGPTVGLEVKGRTLTITSGTARAVVEGLPADDFPSIPTPDGKALDLGPLGALAKRIAHAMSQDSTRPHVHGALLEVGSGRVTLTATDGHRLAQASAPAGDGWCKAILPFAAVRALARFKGSVSAYAGPKFGHFASGTTTVACKFTDAKFPPYDQVIPTSSGRVVRGDIRAALASVPPNDVNRKTGAGGGIELRVAPGIVRIVSNYGSADAAVDYAGPEFRIGVNHLYLTDALVDGAELRFGDTDLDPIRIDAPDYLAVVMPMRM